MFEIQKIRKPQKNHSTPIFVLCFGFRIQKKNGTTMQPPRMALTTSGSPGNTNNNCVADALKIPKGIKNTYIKECWSCS